MNVIRQQLSGPSVTILDQAVVSATNFFTSIILARSLGIQEFGIFSLFLLVIILLDTIHHSLFSAPMMSIAPTMGNTYKKNEYLLSIKTAQAISSLTIALFCYFCGLLVVQQTNYTSLHDQLVPFSLCVFIIPMQEWVRRHLFTKQLTLKALYLDSTRFIIQIVALVYFAYTGMLSIESALYILALSSAITYILGSANNILPSNTSGIRQALTTNWKHARHLIPSHLLEWIRLQGFIILGGMFLGVQAIGAIRAAQNIIGPLNIIYQAADNIFPIEGAKRLASKGETDAIKYFKSVALKGIMLLLIPSVLVAFTSHWIMELTYGDEFAKYHTLIVWQALSLLLIFSLKIGTSLLRTFHTTKPILTSSATGAIVLLILIGPLGTTLNENGVMLAKITAEFLSLVLVAFAIKKLHFNQPVEKQ